MTTSLEQMADLAYEEDFLLERASQRALNRNRAYNEHELQNMRDLIRAGIVPHTKPLSKRIMDFHLRNIAVLDNPDVPHTRDPDTDKVRFTDFEDWVWFKLKYL